MFFKDFAKVSRLPYFVELLAAAFVKSNFFWKILFVPMIKRIGNTF